MILMVSSSGSCRRLDQAVRLLDERFAPLTYSFGFLESPLEKVGTALARWRTEMKHVRDVEMVPMGLSLEDALRALDPLSVHVERELLVSTNSAWTAYFDSFIRGGDPTGPMTVLSDLLGTRAIVIVDCPDTMDAQGVGSYGAVSLELFDCGQSVRWIQSLKDGDRWKWSLGGQPLAFEDERSYSARKISDRFQSATLDRYCRSLGIELTEPSFYLPDELLIRYKPGPNAPRIEMSLADRRRELGLPALGKAPDRLAD